MEMYKLMYGDCTMVLAPLDFCVRYLKIAVGDDSTIEEIVEAGWLIKPAREDQTKDMLEWLS